MNEATRAAIAAVLKADPDISAAHREAVLLTLDTFREGDAPAPPEPMLSPTEAAARLGITRRTLFRWIEAGTFNPVRYTARKIALRLSEITAFEQTGAPPAPARKPARKARAKQGAPAATPARLRAAMKHARKTNGRNKGKQT